MAWRCHNDFATLRKGRDALEIGGDNGPAARIDSLEIEANLQKLLR